MLARSGGIEQARVFNMQVALRACYSSEWRLPGHESVRATFSFPTTLPCYPGLTHFCSRNYHRGDGTPWPEYGELEDAIQRWRNGSFAYAAKPDALTLGTREQIEGEAPIPVETWTTLAGVPEPCWKTSPLLDDEPMRLLHVSGTPDFLAHTLAFDQVDGFRLALVSEGYGRLKFVPASVSDSGMVSADHSALSMQTLGYGWKRFEQALNAYRGVVVGVASPLEMQLLESMSLLGAFTIPMRADTVEQPLSKALGINPRIDVVSPALRGARSRDRSERRQEFDATIGWLGVVLTIFQPR